MLEVGGRAATAPSWTPEQFAKMVGNGVVLVAEDVAERRLRTRLDSGFICANTLAKEWEIENIVVDAGLLRRRHRGCFAASVDSTGEE